ncbi:MAG: InlB B-repeat-containing protein, partial [Treponema sp.]|nr:InlB B-repeat-containing protein [Treponema sp.]
GGNGNHGRAYLSSIAFGDGRTILPNSNFDIATSIGRFELRGTALDADEPTETLLGTWDSSEAGSAYSLMLADISSNSIELAPGSWNFSVTAYIFNGETAVPVLHKTIEGQAISNGGNRLNFGTLDEVAGNGRLSVTLEYPKNTGLCTVDRVTVALEPLPGSSFSVSEGAPLPVTIVDGDFNSVTYTAELESGNYIIKFKFYLNGTSSTPVYTELAHIATGLESSARRRISNLDSLYSITYTLNGGSNTGTLQGRYTPYDADIALATSPIISKTGATFVGWYEASNYSGNVLSTIATGTTGNKQLYAKWGYEMDVNAKVISANGANLIVQQEGPATRIYFDEDHDGVADADEVILDDNGQSMDFTGWTIYGGSQGGNYSGNTSVTVNGGNLSAVYGGNGNGNVSGTHVAINGGTIGTVYGGGSSGGVSGNTVVDVNGGNVGKVVGGSQAGTTAGSSVINISGGSVTEVSGNKDNVTGNSSVNISGNPTIGSPSSEKGIDLDSVDGGFVTATGNVTGEVTVVTTDNDKLATGTVIVRADDNVNVGDDVTIIDTENHIRIDDIGRGVDGNYSVGNSPLRGITMNQYGQRNAVSGECYNITETYSPYTVDYTGMNLKTSVNYVGNIVVTPEWNPDYFVSVSATLSGTLADASRAPTYPAKTIGEIVLDANGSCSIPVGTYGYYSQLVLTYVVQAKDPAQTVTYTFPVEVSQLETLAATEVQSNGYYSVPDATEYDNMTSFKFSNGGVDFQGRISGVNNGNWTNTTYHGMDSAIWHYYLKIDNVNKGMINITPSGDGSYATYSGNGITLTVRAEVQMADGISYTTLIHQIDNPNGKTVSLGVCSDTEVLRADDVPIVETDYGYYLYGPGSESNAVDMILVMYLRNSTGVDDVTGLWYGNYDDGTYMNHVWDSAPYKGIIDDSTAAFHWDNITGRSETRTIRMALRKNLE